MGRKRNEMEEFSRALEVLLAGETLRLSDTSQDTLPSKIRHQLMRLSDAMAGSRERAAQDQQEIREMIAELAHQMRNPLANMESYLELLDMEEDPGERRFCLDAVKDAERRIRFQTEGFLKMARLEQRIIQNRKDAEDLEKTVLDCILQEQKAAEEKGIELLMTGEHPKPVRHDAVWLGEAVCNLLDNSIKYSPPESVVEVELTANEMFARILVRDFGVGIESEEEALIFQRFYRGVRTRGSEGFGLGLYLAREIVRQHDGFMKVTRRKQGLETAIYLPEE